MVKPIVKYVSSLQQIEQSRRELPDFWWYSWVSNNYANAILYLPTLQHRATMSQQAEVMPNSEKTKPIALAADKLGLSESITYNAVQDYKFNSLIKDLMKIDS